MEKFDFLIVGSGFSGSITAMALVNSGYSVCLIEKESHPRFAIGESSTPIADMVLRTLADNYNLPFLKKISRYGEWQDHYPQIVCGLKRGFSYYHHQKGERFTSDKNHSRELLVAASANDQNSDTNWLRSDVDHFLVKKAMETGVTFIEQTEVQTLGRNSKNETWKALLKERDKRREIVCRWIIDATGSPYFSNHFFNTKNSSTGFKTNSSAIYTHFHGAGEWYKYLNERNFKTTDYPYNPDHSALHHLLEEGWLWMLRFNNHQLSAGILLDENCGQTKFGKEPEKVWDSIIQNYPSLADIFKDARVAEIPNQFFRTKRLQRKLDKLYGDGWVVLPNTAGFIDPLHSTGIAHTLTGVEYILNFFTKDLTKESRREALIKYQNKVFKELIIIDLLVSVSYCTRSDFELFTASVMLYFISSVRYEQRRLQGDIPETFLCAGEIKIWDILHKTFDEIAHLNMESITKTETESVVERIRERIEPFNLAGLMDPRLKNMYRHTAVAL